MNIAIESFSIPPQARQEWVKETKFGKWFVSTDVWIDYVLKDAIAELRALLGDRVRPAATILEAGCGIGLSFPLLDSYFTPRKIVGFDIDKAALETAAATTRGCGCEVALVHGTASHMEFPDESFDLVFSHQLIHHVKDQTCLLSELLRVLRPGGFLLSSESCRSFIESFWVKVLFRHPRMVQKSAEEYVALMRAAGFEVSGNDIRTSVPWWSLVDFGFLQRLGFDPPKIDPTEILTVARKPD